MLSRILIHKLIYKLIAFVLALLIFNTYVLVSRAAPSSEKVMTHALASISARGEVYLNTLKIPSGSTVFPGSVIRTGPDSSAFIFLGERGLVELLPDSVLKLSYDERTVDASLDRGRARFSTAEGMRAFVKIMSGEVAASDAVRNQFLVSVVCGRATVSAEAGSVELTIGDEKIVVATGHVETTGTNVPGCAPLDDEKDDDRGISRKLAAILLGAVAATLITIILVDRKDDAVVVQEGHVVIPSGSR